MAAKKKNYSEYRKEDLPAVKFPKNTAQYVEIQEASGDGILKVGNGKYARLWAFFDNGYPIEMDDTQEDILGGLARLYASVSCDLQVSIINCLDPDADKEEQAVQLLPAGDGHDDLREQINAIVDRRMIITSKVITRKVITATIESGSFEAARAKFVSMEMSISAAMERIKSKISALDLEEVMALLFAIENPGAKQPEITPYKKKHIRDTLALNKFGFEKNLVKSSGRSGTWYTKLLYVREFGEMIDDEFLLSLAHLQYPGSISIHIRPIDNAVSKDLLLRQLTKVQDGINKEQDRNNKAGHFHSEISYNRQQEQKKLKGMLDDLQSNNERLLLSSFTISIWGRTPEELEKQTEAICEIGKDSGVEIADHELKLREAYITALPLGLRMTRVLRPMFSQSLSGFNPFDAVDYMNMSPEALYYGINAKTKKLLMIDRKKLHLSHGIIVGKSGAGKSLFNKMEKIQVYLKTNDDIIIVDPMSEYRKLTEGLGGVFYECGGTQLKFNPLAPAPEQVVDKTFIDRKLVLMDGIMQVIMKDDFRAGHQDTLEMAVKKMYASETAYNIKKLQTMLEQTEGQFAKDLALSLNRLTEGTLNIFSNENAQIQYKRITTFGLSANGLAASDERTSISMMVILDYIEDRVAKNWVEHKTTWIDVDEFQRIFSQKRSAIMFADFWQTTRKLQAICTALTPTIRNIGRYEEGKNILTNNGYKAIFLMDKMDRVDAEDCFELTDVHLQYIRLAAIGCGILKVEEQFYQMNANLDEKERGGRLYELINTNPYEVMQ